MEAPSWALAIDHKSEERVSSCIVSKHCNGKDKARRLKEGHGDREQNRQFVKRFEVDQDDGQLSIEDATSMIRKISDEEIKNAMFQIDDNKASRPDGFSAHFFKKAWNTVGKDVCLAVQEFFETGRILREINLTLIALVPKSQTPQKVSDFKSIACCNVIYKCIRVFEGYDRKVGPKRVALKSCGYFKGWRSLRQGDPMSPYLFTLVMEILTLIIKRKVELSHNFQYHFGCKKLKITNVCFADDLLMFCHADRSFVKVLRDSIKEFGKVAGLIPNYNKSTIIFGCLNNEEKQEILEVMPFKVEKLPIDGVVKDINKILKDFLWNQNDGTKGRPKVALKKVCSFKQKGGLGLKDLGVWNKAMIVKHLWHIVTDKESLKVKWVNAEKLKGRSLWEIEENKNDSWG
ncbi:RNA-directed DNA polymerase, eukaryota, reverse transcriptase zinc-binding domain protein [Tanacetum coccineum]|uniref:RNA-directed DNA polymerase, eukaryota, reverse transcriptase zinc-binding domain protein n=1 Tax=Tanacetum coccineum TaxID=301880 RepID=A0ABQ4XU45_9ASTR